MVKLKDYFKPKSSNGINSLGLNCMFIQLAKFCISFKVECMPTYAVQILQPGSPLSSILSDIDNNKWE